MDPRSVDDEEPVVGTIVVQNHMGMNLNEVYIKTCDLTAWGSNRLEAGEFIEATFSRSWETAPGCYDVRAVTHTGVARQFFDATLNAGQTRVFRIE